MLTLVEVVACLLARFGVVFCSKAGLSIQVQYTPISRSEVLCYDFVHRKEADRFWSHSTTTILQKRNCRKQKQTCLLTCFENDFRPPFHWCLNYLTAPCSNWISVRKPLSTYENWLLLPTGKSLAHFWNNDAKSLPIYQWKIQSG